MMSFLLASGCHTPKSFSLGISASQQMLWAVKHRFELTWSPSLNSSCVIGEEKLPPSIVYPSSCFQSHNIKESAGKSIILQLIWNETLFSPLSDKISPHYKLFFLNFALTLRKFSSLDIFPFSLPCLFAHPYHRWNRHIFVSMAFSCFVAENKMPRVKLTILRVCLGFLVRQDLAL